METDADRKTRDQAVSESSSDRDELADGRAADPALPIGPGGRVLVVDDDTSDRERLTRGLERFGYLVSVAHDHRRAIALLTEGIAGAVVEFQLQTGIGLQLLRAMRAVAPTTRLVVLTGHPSAATAVEAMKLGVVEYLSKPADIGEVLAVLRGEPLPPRSPPGTSLPTLARIEWEYINRVLRCCGGNVSHAARQLGISRHTLRRKLGKFAPLN